MVITVMNCENHIRFKLLINELRKNVEDNRKALDLLDQVEGKVDSCANDAFSGMTNRKVALAEDLSTIASILDDRGDIKRNERKLLQRLIDIAKKRGL